MTGTTSSVENPASLVDVPMLCVCWFPGSADIAASFPTISGSPKVGTVESLVSEVVNEFEIGDFVVLLVAVSVVDLVPFGDWAIDSLPDPDVNELESSVEMGSVIPL